ncbi:MAG: hypothetical protein JNN04_06430 [Cyclobacteriaceae bacterium]|nr:hypothetical protein [Cyclobacteriaceae bacterium]
MKALGTLILIACFFQASAQEFHLVFLNKKEDKAELPEEQVKKLMEGHMANINQLAKEGKLWAAGPFDGGGGIFIFKTASLDDVKSWILTDPAVKAERWNVEIFPYVPRTGSVCAVGEKFEMTNYFFVRYFAKEPGKRQSDQDHRDYLTSSFGEKMVAEGQLGDGSASILVLREEPSALTLDQDPAVKSSMLAYTVKKIFIARGSFCEPK